MSASPERRPVGRPPADPAGAAVPVRVKLGPTDLALLERLRRVPPLGTRRRKSSRSAVVREALKKMMESA